MVVIRTQSLFFDVERLYSRVSRTLDKKSLCLLNENAVRVGFPQDSNSLQKLVIALDMLAIQQFLPSTMSAVLGTPIVLSRSGRTVPNVFLKSAMSERLCTWDDEDLNKRGRPTPEYLRLYKEWGQGEIGVIVLGSIPCDARYPEARGNPVMDPTSTWNVVEAFKPVMAAAKANGSLVLGQVTHGGRQTSASIAKVPVSSSDVQSPSPGGLSYGKPRPLTVEEIKDVVNRFAFAARTLYESGADGIQLHAAHGYLLSQFLSPRVNRRTDQYGGSLDNRSRIVFEIIEKIKTAVPDEKFVIAIKINSQDFSEGGFSVEESKEMAIQLEAAGVDIIELSGGTYESTAFRHVTESTKAREAFFIEFAERIRPHLSKAKLCVTGGFRSIDGMVRALEERSTDMIGIASPLTAEPRLCADLIHGRSIRAKPNHVDTKISSSAAIIQMEEIGRGLAPSDLSNKDVAGGIYDRVNGPKQPTPATVKA